MKWKITDSTDVDTDVDTDTDTERETETKNHKIKTSMTFKLLALLIFEAAKHETYSQGDAIPEISLMKII